MLYYLRTNKEAIKQSIRDHIETLPYKDRVARFALFGSYLHNTANEKSDIDILVEFNKPVGFIGLARIKRAMEDALNKPVDLVTPQALSKFFREDVLKEAETLYDTSG